MTDARLAAVTLKRQQSLSPDRKRELTQRLLVELVEFISPKKPKEGELGGRNSGSLAWRIARGETRAAPETATQVPSSGPHTHLDKSPPPPPHICIHACALIQSAGFVFTPTDREKADRFLHVRYSSVKDEYCRVSNNSEVIQAWDRCLWTKESVFRKVEPDWEMVRSNILCLDHLKP